MRNRRICIAVLWWAVSLAPSAVGQQAAATDSTGTISGRFVAAGTGRPLRGVMVTVTPDPSETEQQLTNRTVVSADNGAFEFDQIVPGNYMLHFSKPGYGRTMPYSVTVASGETIGGIELELTPPGVISGTVFDPDGNLFPGAHVEAEGTLSGLPPGWVRAWNRGGTTDDQGRYRIWGLRPGRYHVLAHGARAGQRHHFSATYYANSIDRTGASPVRLDWETEASGIDIRMGASPGIVAGVLRNGVTGEVVPRQPIWILPERRIGGRLVNVTTAQDGTFVVEGLGPGVYRLRASTEDPPLYAAGELVVVGDKPQRIDLELLPGVRISGVARLAGSPSPQPALEKAFAFDFELQDPLAMSDAPTPTYQESDGTFVVENVPPGTYRVRSNCGVRQGYAVGLAIADRDLPSLELQVFPGVPISGLEVRCGFEWGEVRGVIQPSAGAGPYKLAPQAYIWALPVDDSSPRDIGQFPVGSNGRFSDVSVPVGRYTFYAVSGSLDINWHDPDVVRVLASFGQTVEVRAGETAELELVYVPSSFRLP